MNIRRIHYASGLILSVFIGMHLFNHIYAILGPERHIAMMDILRMLYRNIVSETVLLAACAAQIVTGILQVRRRNRVAPSRWERLQVWSGLYLAGFLVVHLTAILVGRFVLGLDTNFYFGAAGMNAFPTILFFVPYYVSAIMAVAGHIAAVHVRKATRNFVGLTPQQQGLAILAVGAGVTIAVFYGMTGHFGGVEIPAEYGILIGK
jgi:hypothetical protein